MLMARHYPPETYHIHKTVVNQKLFEGYYSLNLISAHFLECCQLMGMLNQCMLNLTNRYLKQNEIKKCFLSCSLGDYDKQKRRKGCL